MGFSLKKIIAQRFQYSFEDSVLKIKYLNGNENLAKGFKMQEQVSSDFYIADIEVSLKDDCGFQIPNEND